MLISDQSREFSRIARLALGKVFRDGNSIPEGYKVEWTGGMFSHSSDAKTGLVEWIFEIETAAPSGDSEKSWIDEDGWDVDLIDWIRDRS